MSSEKNPTEFAPAEKSRPEEILEQNKKLTNDPLTIILLDSFPEGGLILNTYRQIVLANSKFLNILNMSKETITGMRPGEAFGCIYSGLSPGGCGTTKFCRYCGAVRAILNTQATMKQSVEEYTLLAGDNGEISAMNLRVWATPAKIGDEMFTIFAINDISDEKHRLALERIFFHDMLNTATGIQGIMEIWPDLAEEEREEMGRHVIQLSRQLISEIISQREILAAEHGELCVKKKNIDSSKFLSYLCELYRYYSIADGKIIEPPEIKGSPIIHTDETILGRILGNLLKNALEASQSGEKVKISYENAGTEAIFSVHNQAIMPEEVKFQIFKKFFTTKSDMGHGLGTYSVKLLTEKYLQGKIDFTSTKEEGTIFTVRIPAGQN